MLYPRIYLDNVTQITSSILKKYNITGLILDVDNTLIDFNKNMLDGVKEWCENLKKEGIRFCILSNSNKKEKIEKVANELNIPYINFAQKPFKKGFLRAKNILNLKNENIAVVGDQIFTDIIRSK